VSQRTTCRSCGSADLATILDFGPTPLADRLVPRDRLGEEDPVWPLNLVFCRACALVQVTFDVPGEAYGDDYPYYTSTNPGLVEHFAEGARQIHARSPLGEGGLVVEIASNDGVQLAPLRELGATVLGVDPASGPAAVANERGLTTRCEFFTADSAARIAAELGRAQVLVGNNALNLLPDLADFRRAVQALLAEDGILVLEVPSLLETLEQGAFDNVFHQNATYWSLLALGKMLAPIGLEPFDVQAIPTFGGSLRVFCAAGRPVRESVREQLASERAAGLDGEEAFAAFGQRARGVRDELRSMLLRLGVQGKRCVAYGAAGGMATTLLSFLDLPPGVLEYAVDLNPHKHGSWTPGYRLEIRPVETLLEDRPDVALLLAWNFAEAILGAQREWREGGGQFLVPIPEPRLV
jgi:SAM-dependent methyltransferase